VSRFAGRRVAVIGDVMLDHFVFGRVNRISPEAPVPVVEFDHEQFRLGGAANVAHNLRALGAYATLVGLVGDDDSAREVEAGLSAQDIDATTLVRTSTRPTSRKMRIVTTRNQQVARVDYEDDRDITGSLEDDVLDAAVHAAGSAEIVLVSDYLKGVVTGRVMRGVVEAATRRGAPVLVDPKIPHIDHYRGATLITPNHHEAEVATAMRIRSDEEARRAARAFRERAGCASVVITRGEHGMWVLDGGPGPEAGEHAPREVGLSAAAREVSDVTGAGDTVIATLAAALAAGATLIEAATLATHAAAVSVSKFGPSPVTPGELVEVLERAS
jgi:D-beta-D-heptose 7-phosphate kinase/D-beta-D-heptose 1-phosphate adenosyltransferase